MTTIETPPSDSGTNADLGREADTNSSASRKKERRSVLNPRETHALGVFLFLLTILLFYLFLGVWPRPLVGDAKGEAWTGIVWFPGFEKCDVGPEIQLILVVALAGALGGVIHAGFSFTSHVGGGGFDRDWVWWSVFRFLLGGTLAVLFFFAVRAGVLTSDANVGSVNPYGVAALSGLVGMFSREAKDVLQRTFEALSKAKSSNSSTSGDSNTQVNSNTLGGQGDGKRGGHGSGEVNAGKDAAPPDGKDS